MSFKRSRNNLYIPNVGVGFERALWATYLSYLEPKDFLILFISMKTSEGYLERYLNTKIWPTFFFYSSPWNYKRRPLPSYKTEKFFIVKGKAQYKFKNILTNEVHKIIASEIDNMVIETIPGWSHDITNIGETELIVVLWASEILIMKYQIHSIMNSIASLVNDN